MSKKSEITIGNFITEEGNDSTKRSAESKNVFVDNLPESINIDDVKEYEGYIKDFTKAAALAAAEDAGKVMAADANITQVTTSIAGFRVDGELEILSDKSVTTYPPGQAGNADKAKTGPSVKVREVVGHGFTASAKTAAKEALATALNS